MARIADCLRFPANETPPNRVLLVMRTRMATLLLIAAACAAQPAPSFEVASIKLNPDGPETSFSYGIAPSGILTSRNLTLWNLIRFAFALRDNQISGAPAWAKTQGFDIQAQPAGPVSREQSLQMLQTLLKDRFQLRFHMETRELPAYTLTVTNGGSKLPPADGEEARTLRMGDLNSPSMTLAALSEMLGFELERPVVDRTGLAGPFAIHLQWASDRAPVPDSTLPSLFTAVQEQLGLKLESTRAPVEIFVIDSVQQPSEN